MRNYFLILLLSLFQISIAVQYVLFERFSFIDSAVTVISAMVSLLALLVFLFKTNEVFVPKKFQAIVPTITTIFFIIAQVYQLNRGEPLGIILLTKYGAELLSERGQGVFLENLTYVSMASYTLLPPILWYVHRKFKIFTPQIKMANQGKVLITLLMVNLILAVIPTEVENDLFSFLRSIKNYYSYSSNSVANHQEDTSHFPYYKNAELPLKSDFDFQNAPNIFIVMLESFSSLYIDGYKENGKVITPLIDSLIETGAYYENFFSNSVETSKGEFSTLCSVIPSFKGNVFNQHSTNQFRCLPQILKDHGYKTSYIKAYHDLSFENTGPFVKRNGFDFVTGMTKKYVTKKERDSLKIGWGVQDDFYYQKVFEILDKQQEKNRHKQPHFVKTMSVTNHMWFEKIPKEQRYIYPDADSTKENYANSVHLTDKYLREFFKQLKKRDYLKNSIVMILGDNGYPMGQHNNFLNQKTAYNEMFKTPLLILWPGHLDKERDKKNYFSQLDIAPTILDLIDLKTPHHFWGNSVFDPKEDSFIPLIQPFDGMQIGLISPPFKAVYQQSRDRFTYFNLEKDPLEKSKISSNKLGAQKVQFFKELKNRILKNEQLIEEDRIFPKDGIISGNASLHLPKYTLNQGEDLMFNISASDQETLEELRIKVSCYQPQAEHPEPIPKSFVIKEGTNQLSAKYLCNGINRLTLYYKRGRLQKDDFFVKSDDIKLASEFKWNGKQSWGKLRINKSTKGTPLKVSNKTYRFGMGTHTKSSYLVKPEEQYKTLQGLYGLDQNAKCGDGATFKIFANDSLIHQKKISRKQGIQNFNLDISEFKEFKFTTTPNKNRKCDHTDWINVIFIKGQNENN